MTSLAARIKALEASQQIKVDQHIKIDGCSIDYLTGDNPKPYRASKTLEAFHNDNSFVKCVMGPYGSGKSTGCCEEVVEFAADEMPPCTDGIRRTRAVFIRNTYGELEGTTLKTWQTWNEDLGHVKSLVKPPYMFHTFNDGKGIVELEIVFLALDRPDHIKKLKSAEFSIAYLNEACELPEVVLTHIKGRVGRYPSKNMLTRPFKGKIIMDTNPPDTDHWLYKLFEEARPQGFKIFKQPPGLIKNEEGEWITNPEADNIQHLEDDYYVKQTYGASEEFIKVYCLGQYGAVISGKPVYPEYNDDMHSVDEIKPIEGLPLLLGWDFGLTPACIVSQQDAKGRVYDIQEYVGESIDLESFLTDVVKPSLAKQFPGFEIEVSEGDPAGAARADTDSSDCLSLLAEHGIKTEAADTNDPIVRQRAVRYFLNRMIEGKPAYQLSRKGCPVLRKGFIGGYQFKRLQVGGEARFKDVADKNKFSHIHDAKQYQALRIKGDDIQSAKKPVNSKQFINHMTAWG